MSQAKNWTFTINNPTDAERTALESLEQNAETLVTYCIYQTEEGAAATPHIQGYLQLSTKKRLPHLKRFVSARAHWEIARGTVEQNKAYCTKEPRLAGPVEFGSPSVQGKRTDIEEFVADMTSCVMSELECLEKHPVILAKYPRFVSTTRRIVSEKRITQCPLSPRPGWQVLLRDALAGPADPRRVTWYFDEYGASGKSYFARGYRRNGLGGYIVTGGKHADIYFAYQRQPVVFFDWPRCQSEAFPYAVVECFKNGYFLSTKYESTPVYFDPPHVVVFSNMYPDKSKLSADRWDIHTINNTLLNNTLS